jgi:PAS domain S-box-containing protein
MNSDPSCSLGFNPQKDSHQTYSIQKINDLFSLLGSDPEENIRIIVQQACEVLNSASSLYNRIDDTHTSLISWSGYNLPPGFPPSDSAKGHVCYEATLHASNQPVIIEDLNQTSYLHTDPYIKRYGLRSYLGHPVYCGNQAIGSLCVVDIEVRKYSNVEIYVICTLAKAISLEEERIRVESALRSSEKKYRRLYKMLRLLTDNVPDLIWAKDLEDRYIFTNQALCDKLLKCSRPDEAIGHTQAYFTQRERDAGYQHTFGESNQNTDDTVLRRRTSGRFLEEGLVRNQQLLLDIHKAPFWDEDGELIGTVGCGRDVTREKQTEKALQESERRYRNLYNNTPVMLFSIDRNDCLISVSNLWLEAMAYQRDEVIGRYMFDFFTPESRRKAVETAFRDFYKSGRMLNHPFQLITKKRRVKEVLLSAIAERDNEGNYAGALAFVVDLTESKRIEKEKRNLTNRLQQAQKMEAIATLAGGIAHQFNNALAVIMGNLELIQMDGPADEKQLRFIKPINQASQKMVQLTSQLLAYARGGKFQTQILPAASFVKDTLRLVGHSIAPSVDLETELNETTDFIEVDQTQMQMLLAAILSNASEAIENQGKVRITLENIQIDKKEMQQYHGLKSGPMVCLKISDNGKGMDQETCERIFEPFYTTKFTGRGLGMAAVYGIVKKHGGYVYVDSEKGQGTTVTIFLPPVKAPLTSIQKTALHSAKQAGTALIVEDEHLVMEVNKAIVEKLGYKVLEARNGKDAVHIAQTHEGRIDFALLDVILPDMSGNKIYPQLMACHPNLKVIVCSGFALDGPAQDILNAGADSFLQKPFTVTALSAKLDALFSEQQ